MEADREDREQQVHICAHELDVCFFSRSWCCPYFLSAYGNRSTMRGLTALCICNVCITEILSGYSTQSQYNLITFKSLPQISFGALPKIMSFMPSLRPNGLVCQMQLMAPTHHTRPQDVRINLTTSVLGQNGPPLPFDVSKPMGLCNFFLQLFYGSCLFHFWLGLWNTRCSLCTVTSTRAHRLKSGLASGSRTWNCGFATIWIWQQSKAKALTHGTIHPPN